MKVVRIWGPNGGTMSVFEVVTKTDGGTLSYVRSPDGAPAREMRGRYASLQEALDRNARATTTAEMVDAADLAAARAMVEEQDASGSLL